MAGLSEQIVAAVRTALYNTIPAVGTRVYRARADAVVRDECPAIVIDTVGESSEVADLAGSAVRVELQFAVTVHVADGDPWETAADEICVLAHAAMMGATLPTGATISGAFDSESSASGDQTPGSRAMTYTAVYFRQAAALDAVPA